ncbi:hypothetical protein GPA10_22180 [Streptomyces sp. p1417]|uniref:Uncharacterized protein n=1 Tax=Streptomyces typhae TaxID=2681492 RepID=A0A6L6X100_9ACTN|nr:hypothetical protein [Streptomyces typhae]MVO87396.1 hypothetical protein [Streptomyces typhae]
MAEKIRITVITEYIPDLEHYPDAETVAQAAEFDERENPFVEFPDAYLDDPSEIVSVKYEIIPV